ncbi:MAG: zinc carboxypeptidase, partial [Nakamurella sp.]
YVYSQQSDTTHKRLTRTVDLSAASTGELTFWSSYDIEADWDFMFVEAHEVGTDNWTTLPDANGKTTTETGESCTSGWVEQLHPFLGHYQQQTGTTCVPVGSTGVWNAATGQTQGWQQWKVDLTPYAGKQVELSISYASDWSTQGVGVFLDDISVLADGSPVAETGFEADLGGWVVSGTPDAPPSNSNDWLRTELGFEEGAITTTQDTIYAGFGYEGLPPAERDDLVARSMQHLLAPPA